MNLSPRIIVLSSLLAAALGGAPAVLAQTPGERALPNLTLKKTYIKTFNGASSIGPADAEAFTPTTIACPGGGGCVVRVEVSALIGMLPIGGSAVAGVTIDGEPVPPTDLPGGNPMPVTAHAPSAGTFGVRTFVWAAEVGPGAHTVEVKFRALGGTTILGFRSLTVSVFR